MPRPFLSARLPALSLVAVLAVGLGTRPALAQIESSDRSFQSGDESGQVAVPLSEPTTTDAHRLNLSPFQEKPPESDLQLPASVDAKARFFTLWDPYEDEAGRSGPVTVMVRRGSQADTLYVDQDNDNNLAEEEPLVFPRQDNEQEIWIHAPDRHPARAGRLLGRHMPRWAYRDSSIRAHFDQRYDEEGRFKTWPIYQARFPDFTGKKGTFYFTQRLMLRRGSLDVGNESYEIGLLDFGGDGTFSSESDRLLIDLNGDRRLQLANNPAEEVFLLSDVFRVGNTRFAVDSLSPDHRTLYLRTTNQPVTRKYLTEVAQNVASEATTHRLHPDFWQLDVETIAGETISMDELRGRYLLLNFWGEWCAPCIAEIPHLVELQETYPADSLQIIGFLETANLPNARDLMAKESMDWPQVFLSDTLQNRFNVIGFPTNVLIHPDGQQYHRTNMISEEVLDRILP